MRLKINRKKISTPVVVTQQTLPTRVNSIASRPFRLMVPIKKPTPPIIKKPGKKFNFKPLVNIPSKTVTKKTMAGIGANVGYGDFGSPMGLNLLDVITGKTSITTAISSLAYDEAMKQVSKYGNIVTSFANKAKSAANGAISTFNQAQASVDPTQLEALAEQAKKFYSTASNEYNNAVKNYSLTVGALNTLLKIPGLPSSVKDGANAIIASAKKSVDSAKVAVDTAKQASDQTEEIFAQRGGGGGFLPSFTFDSPFMQKYGTYLMIGGGVLALSLVGLIIYKRMKK